MSSATVKGVIKNSTASDTNPLIANGLSKTGMRLFLDPYFSTSYSGSGTAWNDLSGNNRNATLVGSPAYTGLGLTFGSTNIYADLSSGTGNPSGDWSHSYMVWVKPTVTQGNMSGPNTIWFMGTPAVNKTSSFEMYGNPLFRWYFYSNDADYTSGEIFGRTDWYHLCLTYSGGGSTLTNKKFYVNGVPLRIDTAGSGAALNINANTPFYIGKDVPRNAGFWNGQIGQFALYDGVVSKKQIQDNFNATRSRYSV